MSKYIPNSHLEAAKLYDAILTAISLGEMFSREVRDLAVLEVERLLAYENGRKTKAAAVCEAYISLLKADSIESTTSPDEEI